MGIHKTSTGKTQERSENSPAVMGIDPIRGIPGRATQRQGHPEDAQQRIFSLWKLWSPSLTATLGFLLETLKISPLHPAQGWDLSSVPAQAQDESQELCFAPGILLFRTRALEWDQSQGTKRDRALLPPLGLWVLWVMLQLLEWDQWDPAPLCGTSTNFVKKSEQRQAGHGGRSDREHQEGEELSPELPWRCQHIPCATSWETKRSQRDSQSEETLAGSAALPKTRGR